MRQWAALLLLAACLAAWTCQQQSAEAQAIDWADCLACHENPDSDLPMLSQLRPTYLSGPTAASCSACHNQGELSTLSYDGTHPVRPVAAHLACIDCHVAVPHDSANPPPRYVGDYNAEGCFTCHRSIDAELQMPHSHQLDAVTTCSGCHPAHQPLITALPQSLLPATFDAQVSSYNYHFSNQSCSICHPALSLNKGTQPTFKSLAGTDLHSLHVQQGQSLCIECHEPHGGVQPAMLRTQLLVGEPLIYRRNSTGGSCSVTCHGFTHDDLAYVRSTLE